MDEISLAMNWYFMEVCISYTVIYYTILLFLLCLKFFIIKKLQKYVVTIRYLFKDPYVFRTT